MTVNRRSEPTVSTPSGSDTNFFKVSFGSGSELAPVRSILTGARVTARSVAVVTGAPRLGEDCPAINYRCEALPFDTPLLASLHL